MLKKGVLLYQGAAGKGGEDLATIVPLLSQRVEELIIKKSSKPGDLNNYIEQLDSTVETLWILGGDGTVHECVQALRDKEQIPPIGILPGGTCNDIARSLNIPMQMDLAVESSLNGEIRYFDLGLLRDRSFQNFAGIGLIAETSTNINPDGKELFGPLSYFASAWRTMKEAKQFTYSLTVDGEKISGEAFMVIVCNGRFVGTRELPFNELKMDDGILDVMVVKATGMQLFMEWYQRSRELEVESDGVEHYRGKEIVIETDDEMDVDMDGELIGKTPLHISLKERHIPFITNSSE
ncbi:YegS/Rv2252/BmrU family lipid kinase [Paenalkalicoccus suaedae]|uniref:YegS/Rv2252/BmrU family lipid kinase n=1 Tax=Paenalkalicoccus suaedae TaxID=2592382 RepID=A0A859FCS4_9BACI|nr:YegS/Rv2252/BmrU family lipid kinase [Paenalkalicoccus suaedae]QKS70552.1 YegS/Rv2252/BmrU family lipid kinase [Paenalkalicoccus suaedae]